jgi:hypothetical protein
VSSGGRWLLTFAGLLATAGVVEGTPLRVEGSLVPGDPPGLHVVVRNAGADSARAVTPTVIFEHQSYPGVPTSLDAGDEHEWRLGLPPPSGPGTSPATVRVDWTAATGIRHTLPLVLLVPGTPDPGPEPVDVVWSVAPVATVAHTRVRLANRGPRPVVGRLAFVLPGELSTEPEGQPMTVGARSDTTVPVAIESRGAEPGTYPAYALFTYMDADRRHASLAPAELTVTRPAAATRAVPLAIGAGAVILAVAVLALALRASR